MLYFESWMESFVMWASNDQQICDLSSMCMNLGSQSAMKKRRGMERTMATESRGSLRRTCVVASILMMVWKQQPSCSAFVFPTTRSSLHRRHQHRQAEHRTIEATLPASSSNVYSAKKEATIWEELALPFVGVDANGIVNISEMNDYVQYISLLRVGIPTTAYAAIAKLVYPTIAMALAVAIDDSGVFAVVAQDASQYIQNILTTSGLVFSLLVGQTYYFMYQQQEATFIALYAEVTMAKSLLEQVALVCQGRDELYERILKQMDHYVKDDLQRFNDVEPAVLISARPCDDPLEDILYLTSVGEPSTVYQTVRSLRQARAMRLGALQKKLPPIHMTLLWALAGVVLFTFPLLGAGVQTIGGPEILVVQSWYLSFIVFGMALTLGVIYELQRPGESGAYNARTVLAVMVAGLEEELQQRLSGECFQMEGRAMDNGPSIDSDGFFDQELLRNSPANFS